MNALHDAITQPAARSGIRPRRQRHVAKTALPEEQIARVLADVARACGAQHRFSVSAGIGHIVATACIYTEVAAVHETPSLHAETYDAAIRMLLDEVTRLRARVCDGVSSWP